ncbi:unnamed protein product [Cuscuta epithymum]|uniref:Mediator of RNA polymerase II transcription subunit 14 n=1 Tax=Cuscuta epithymum TaxID=186058 RepID=A0AAV0E262_9ASTE|nr:unnamed protein product [Cuscuta epithymum]CAH9128130.1 unnamed protein product [Cuscuta epithymum]
MAAELGQKTVEFSTLVSRAADESYISLKELVDKSRSSDLTDSDKKIGILQYIVKTQQRMLRLNVLAKWCQQVPLIHYCQQLASTLSSHDTCFTQAADSLFFMHEGLQQARAPIYDVPSATEILLTGSYMRLPKCIEDVGMQSTLNEDHQKPALKKLDVLVRSKLLEASLPQEFTEVKVFDGTVLLRVDGEFKVLVTLGYRGHLSMWRILHLDLLVGERSGMMKLEESRRHALGDDLERRMTTADHPFMTLYSILHELCVALVMDTVIRQVQTLRQGRWKDAIRFELISDGTVGQGGSASSIQMNQDGETDFTGLCTPGLKVLYWLEFEKSASTSDMGSCPYIKIEPGPDLQIKCLHTTFIIDPMTGREAQFFLDQSCIDIEKLLLRAICCNRYTRLLEVYKELEKSAQVCRGPGDVQLKFQSDIDAEHKMRDNKIELGKYDTQEVLLVRAYGSSFFSLGINIRIGRFILQSSKNIIASSVLTEHEDALNQGSMTAAEAFISLRSKSLLHLFASVGRFLGLEVFEQSLASLKLPKDIVSGPNMLLMRFPECGSSYYILMQLEKDFKPVFKLLEIQSDSSGKPQSFGHLTNVIRSKSVDIGQMQIYEDGLNLSLLNYNKLLLSLRCCNTTQQFESSDFSKFSLDGSTVGSAPSNFSSIVDEVFELEKGSSLPSLIGAATSSRFSSSPASHFVPGTTNCHSSKLGTLSPKWEGGVQMLQSNTINAYNSSIYNGMVQSGSTTSPSPFPERSQTMKRLTASKSEQDLLSIRSPHPGRVESYASMGEDQLPRSAQLLSPPTRANLPIPALVEASCAPMNSPAGTVSASIRASISTSLITSPLSQATASATCTNSSHDAASRQNKMPRKRTASDLLDSLPSLQLRESNGRSYKRRRVMESTSTHNLQSQIRNSFNMPGKTDGCSYTDLVNETHKGNAPSTVYVSALLHVIRQCSLCIKHAQLTSQMDAIDIPFVEEVGLRSASSKLWFRIPFVRDDTWQHICLRLGRPGSMYWDVKIIDHHFQDLWELQKGGNSASWGSGVRIANTSDVDSHIRYDSEGVVLSYYSVEADSIRKLVADIQRLTNARAFALGMRKLLEERTDEKSEACSPNLDSKLQTGLKGGANSVDKTSDQLRRAFKIEAVGLMSLWFSYGQGVVARFVVEWQSGKGGCTMHVSPDQLWPHTKFLEDFIDGAEVASLLDCIRLTAGPLHALASATRPARAAPVSGVAGIAAPAPSISKQTGYLPSQGHSPIISNAIPNQPSSGPGSNPGASITGPLGALNHPTAAMLAAAASAAGRGGPGIVPSSLLPIDVSVVLRGPYWIRIIYRKRFAVDMRCFAGDQVWLQPATPPKGGSTAGGSLPCPQFRPFIMEHVAQELNGIDSNFSSGQQAVGLVNSSSSNLNSGNQLTAVNSSRPNLSNSAVLVRSGNTVSALNRVGNGLPPSPSLYGMNPGMPLRRPSGTGVPAHVRGELNTAIIGLGDDGGYGGGWVPLVALKKVLRGILKYLGVLWLFAQLPDLLKEILRSILKDNEGSLLNLDEEQPALRFFVGGYVFAVSVHRVQLLLQVLSVKKFHHSQQQQQQQNPSAALEELSQSEIGEICDYFCRRVASEPYDASRVASFITLLTLPISVLREFLKLIAWKKGLAQIQGVADVVPPAQKSRIELCLESHTGCGVDGGGSYETTKSNIHYDRPRNSVEFALTVVLDPAHIPHINAAGGAAWLPYCVSVRLRYVFGDNPTVSFLRMEGSHGGRACWLRADDWEKCKQRVARIADASSSAGDVNQGRLRVVADNIQRTLHACLQGLREGSSSNSGGSVPLGNIGS